MGKQVFAYIRVSGQGQIEKDGPERQRQAIQAFCERHGLEIANEYFEAGVSGTKGCMERPAFSSLLRDHVDECIVIEKLDRIARELMVQEAFLVKCFQAGIKVYSADYGDLVDVADCTDDPMRKAMRQFAGIMAEMEKANLVMRTREARARKRALTGRCEGRKPYGHTQCEIDVMALAIERFEESGNYADVARYLNDLGLKTRSGTEWNRGTLYRLFKKRSPAWA
ncbi:MAG: recombinase family protein [Planctomycetota bacterium]|jgi:DNA invertase Pin-like site-specific DNA recombinase